jgi:hypothetical protein
VNQRIRPWYTPLKIVGGEPRTSDATNWLDYLGLLLSKYHFWLSKLYILPINCVIFLIRSQKKIAMISPSSLE